METIDLAATTAQALKLLSNQGMSEKSLHAYTHAGFGCVIRHFRTMGIICVSPEMPMVLLSQYLGHAQVETTMIYAYADTEMKRAAIQKADAVRKTKSVPNEIWADNEEMILKLSGL